MRIALPRARGKAPRRAVRELELFYSLFIARYSLLFARARAVGSLTLSAAAVLICMRADLLVFSFKSLSMSRRIGGNFFFLFY